MSKLTNFECPNCLTIEENFEGDKPTCGKCAGYMTDIITNFTAWVTHEMQPIFTPKNNAQRARVND